jgi:hypothetical protein
MTAQLRWGPSLKLGYGQTASTSLSSIYRQLLGSGITSAKRIAVKDLKQQIERALGSYDVNSVILEVA